jgi:putative FmdB family regulatory protein
MPTYEYVCRACGHEFEEFQSIKADPIAVCPKCHKKKVERKVGLGGAVIFKGGGFYETDYRSESYKSGEDAEKKAREPAKEAASAGNDKRDDASPNTKSESKSGAKPGATSDGGTGESRGDSSGSTETKSSAASDASAAAAEKKRIEDRATHHSRIGRGIGNVVKKSSDAAGGKSATPAKGSAPARAAKPAKKSSRK